MDIYAQMAQKIIAGQELIIGPVAIEQAQSIKGLDLDWGKHEVTISGNGLAIIDLLVEQYQELFGQISVEVCKEAVGRLAQQISPEQMPVSLR
jgi:hypothetical protein